MPNRTARRWRVDRFTDSQIGSSQEAADRWVPAAVETTNRGKSNRPHFEASFRGQVRRAHIMSKRTAAPISGGGRVRRGDKHGRKKRRKKKGDNVR